MRIGIKNPVIHLDGLLPCEMRYVYEKNQLMTVLETDTDRRRNETRYNGCSRKTVTLYFAPYRAPWSNLIHVSSAETCNECRTSGSHWRVHREVSTE